MTSSLVENLINSKVKSHYELYVQLGSFKNIDIRYSGKYQVRIRAFIGPNEHSPKKYFKIDERKCENTSKHDSQSSDSTVSSIGSNLSFQEIKKSKKEFTYHCNPIQLEYEFQKEEINETICFVLNKPVNTQKSDSSLRRRSIRNSTASLNRNNTKRFSLYSLYKYDSKRSIFNSNTSLNSKNNLSSKEKTEECNESSSSVYEKQDQNSLSDQSLVSSPSSLLEQEIGFDKMNEKDLNIYLIFRLYVEKEEKQKTVYKKVKDQTYFIGNLDQLINQCFFRRFASIDFGYLYYGIWNMYISFCCTGYQSKPKDLLMAGLRNLHYHNVSGNRNTISLISSNSSPAIFSKRNSIFTHNKHNSSVDVRDVRSNRKRHHMRRELKRSFSDDNMRESFVSGGVITEDDKLKISESTIKFLEKLLTNSCILFKNIFNSLLITINNYYEETDFNDKPEEKYNGTILKFYKILLNIMQHIDLFFGCDGPHYINGLYNDPSGINLSLLALSNLKNVEHTDSDNLYYTLKMRNKSTPEFNSNGADMKPVLSMTDINATASTTVNANANAITNDNINANMNNSILSNVINRICSDTSRDKIAANILALNNKYMVAMNNKAAAAYKIYTKKCESEQDLFSTTIRLINFINDQCNLLFTYYFPEYPLQSHEFEPFRNDWHTREDRLYHPLLFTSSKSDLSHSKINDFLNKWDKINIVDIEDENVNNSKNELRGYFNIYNKEVDPFFKLVKCDKNDTSIENNVHSWPVIISSQVVNEEVENDKEIEIKDIPNDKRENDNKITNTIENDTTIDNDLTLNNEREHAREGSVRSTMSSVSSNEDIKYHLLICVHGFLGNKYDLYTVRDYFERYVNNSEKNRGKMKYVYLLSKINQDNTYMDIESESQKLYEEIEDFMIKKNIKFSHISFVCHSMGGLIARSLIAKTEFIKYWSVLHSFISLSVPHVGMRLKNPFFSLCFKSFLKISSRKKKTSLDQLALQDESDIKNCYIYKLSEKKNFELFKYVHLISVTQDGYVPQYSSLIMPKKEDNTFSQKFIKDVSRNIFTSVFKEKIYRNKYFNSSDNYYNNGGTSTLCDSHSSSLDFVSCNNSSNDLPSKYQSCSSLIIPPSDPHSPNFSLSQSPITATTLNFDQDNITTNTNTNHTTNVNIIHNNSNNNINPTIIPLDTNNIIADCISSLSHLEEVNNLSAESLTNIHKINDTTINTNINSNTNGKDTIDIHSTTITPNNMNTLSSIKEDQNLHHHPTNTNTINNYQQMTSQQNGQTTKTNHNKIPIIDYKSHYPSTKKDNESDDGDDNDYHSSSGDDEEEEDDNKKINLNTFVSSIRNKSLPPRRHKPINHNLVTPKTKVFRYNIHYRTLEMDLLGRTGHIQTLREMFVVRMLFTLINHQVEKINYNDTF
ncbi:DUF676-domain-containing protein [Piromyces finnis]|uniref:DUF676-domain-containing protein n=1 Tax=Piromyces finnis TaxID=1754191 RepID=A0A1Y1VE57_9FUNG|nr:DUF676-domain-containing protein [Piromyces finnis]|eukprot:ORX53867.1 DUF676-domain-containing protein [Piromyces finnis]